MIPFKFYYLFFIVSVGFVLAFYVYFKRTFGSTTEPYFVGHWARSKQPILTSQAITIPQPQSSSFKTTKAIQTWINDPSFYTNNWNHFHNHANYSLVLEPMNKWMTQTTLSDVIKRREQNKQRLLATVSQTHVITKIPKITHSVWISSNIDPYDIPEDKIKRFTQMIEKLPKPFTHYIWFFNRKKNQKNEKKFPNKTNLVFMDIQEQEVVRYGADLFDIYYEQKRYTQCSDIVRFNLIYLYGGIYLDFGTLLNVDVEDLLTFDYFGLQEGFLNSTTVIAAKPKSWVYYALLNMIDNVHRVKNPILRSLKMGNGMVFWTALAGLTWAFDNFLKQDEMYLPLEKDMDLIGLNNMGSWVKGSLGQPSLLLNPLLPQTSMFTRNQIENPTFYSKAQDHTSAHLRHSFASQLGVSPHHLKKNRVRLEKQSLDEFFKDTFALDLLQTPKIPRILHRSWLSQGKEPSHEQLMDVLHTYRILENSYHPWTFYFWTHEPKRIPKTVKFLQKHCPQIKIQSIEPQRDVTLARQTYESHLASKQFAEANMILCKNLLLKYGGLYLDSNISLEYDISVLLVPYDNILFFHDEVLNSSCLGAKVGDPLLKEWLEMLDRKEFQNFLGSQPFSLVGSCYLMTLLDIKYTSRKVLMFRNQFYVKFKPN